MEIQETQTVPRYRDIGALFDWCPDLDRFDREIQKARDLGRGDPLTLAEMECSLDLLEADLSTVRAATTIGDRASYDELSRLRTRLNGQIAIMRRLVDE